MKTNIDTIREALEKWQTRLWVHGGTREQAEAFAEECNEALAALSTIEAGSKIYEASTNPTAPVHVIGIAKSEPQKSIDDAIRREERNRCEDIVCGLWPDKDAIRAAILATEPAREES